MKYIVMMLVIIDTILLSLNYGFDLGYRTGTNDAVISGIRMHKMECHYTK